MNTTERKIKELQKKAQTKAACKAIEEAKKAKKEQRESKNGKIFNYAIIDHVNSIEHGLGDAYKKVYKMIKEDHYKMNETCYKIKDVCYMVSPYTNHISKKFKTWIRHNKNPEKVYLICENMRNADAKYAYNCWAERGIEVEVIEADPIKLEDGTNPDNDRKTAMTWAKALGETFEAPIKRDYQELNSPDLYQERPDRKLYENNPLTGNHITGTWHKGETMTNKQSRIARDWQIKDFIKKYEIYKEKGYLTECLDIDYTICPKCGKPVKHNFWHEFRCSCGYQTCTDEEWEHPNPLKYLEDIKEEYDTYNKLPMQETITKETTYTQYIKTLRTKGTAERKPTYSEYKLVFKSLYPNTECIHHILNK